MIQKLRLLGRALHDGIGQIATDQESRDLVLVGLLLGFCIACFTAVPFVIYTASGVIATIEYIVTTILVAPISAVLAVGTGLTIAYTRMSQSEWDNFWMNLRTEYGGM